MTQPTEPRIRDTLKRFVRELSVPAALAGLWTLANYTSAKQPPTITALIGQFVSALFFVAWFSGNLVRIHKQLRMDNAVKEILSGVNQIREHQRSQERSATTAPPGSAMAASAAVIDTPAVSTSEPATTDPGNAYSASPPTLSQLVINNGKQTQPNVAVTPARSMPTADEIVGRTLLSEAEATIMAGHIRSGLVMGGAALEQALHALLEAKGLNVERTDTFPVLLEKARHFLPVETVMELRRVWNLRNIAAHDSSRVTLPPVEASELLQIIKNLSRTVMSMADKRNDPYTGVPCYRCKQPTMGSGTGSNQCGNCGFISEHD
ncbi:hypothetical protein ACIHQR_30305 [Corallococcus coralloides]|uniref:hypothetical protein n=1 Tax=Corallococcus coralloides TaxID=184914 RepID=UPI00384E9E76